MTPYLGTGFEIQGERKLRPRERAWAFLLLRPMLLNECQTHDWGRSCWSLGFAVAWGLPILAMIVSASSGFGVLWIWPISLAWMGIACLLNARRCGRRHCYFTGPFFLVMALVAGLYGAGALDLGSNGWQYIGNVAVIGGLLLGCIPEMIWGRYRRG